METLKLTILEPDAMEVIADLEKKGSVKIQKVGPAKKKTKAERLKFYLSAPVMTDEEYEEHLRTREWMSKWRTK